MQAVCCCVSCCPLRCCALLPMASPIAPLCTTACCVAHCATVYCCPWCCLWCCPLRCRALLPIASPIALPCAAACHVAHRAAVHCCPSYHLLRRCTLLVLGCHCGVKEVSTGLWGLHTEPGESKIRVSVTYHWYPCSYVRSRCC